MGTPGHLYVVRYGTSVKIGRTVSTADRFGSYRRDADRAGVPFEALWVSPLHVEVEANERDALDHFRPVGQRDEYIRNGNPDAIIAYVQTLPFTSPHAAKTAPKPAPPKLPRGKLLTRTEAADALRVSVRTIDRLIATKQLTRIEVDERPRVRVLSREVYGTLTSGDMTPWGMEDGAA